MNGLSLLDHLSVIRDPRQQWKIEHKLADILFLTVAAVIGGAEGWEDIEDFGHDHLDWLRQHGDFGLCWQTRAFLCMTPLPG
ncbi:hypothetical protein GCM10011502_26280 [Oceanisphaera marina]|uniref:H repeat-associated protein N-terminal domain-containing protein n=1 Tax=Oceanisphaera marina TaxID=2017550 RepID=A0ABQ1IU33_9GAMM|nr:hypothetical protein GCM10011502_26280 [Oceanisphaera marina]